VKTSKTKRKRDQVAVITSDITGHSYDSVRRIRNGERENDQVEQVVVEVAERLKVLKEEVKKAVPFDTPLRHPIKK
jgi:predicted translin family RNA/ssDNA-binding protein